MAGRPPASQVFRCRVLYSCCRALSCGWGGCTIAEVMGRRPWWELQAKFSKDICSEVDPIPQQNHPVAGMRIVDTHPYEDA